MFCPDAGQNIGLFFNLVCNRDVTADRNGAIKSLTFLGDFIPGGRQSSMVNMRFLGNLMVSFFSVAITLSDQHLPHNDTLRLARSWVLRGQSFSPKEVSS